MKTVFAIAAAYLVSIAAAPAITLFFEGLPVGPMQTNYDVFLWSGWVTVNGPLAPGGPSGYPNAVVSPYNVIGNIDGRFTTLSNGPAAAFFNLNSAYLTSVYNDGLHVEVQGFHGNSMVYDNTYTIDTTAPSLILFNYASVNVVKFIPSGGTLHPGYADHGVANFNFALDNLTTGLPIPEPGGGTLVLLGSATAGLRIFHRKRRQGG